ncbi:hypothetical protein BGZ82_004301, partial [Podila clonocystis]
MYPDYGDAIVKQNNYHVLIYFESCQTTVPRMQEVDKIVEYITNHPEFKGEYEGQELEDDEEEDDPDYDPLAPEFDTDSESNAGDGDDGHRAGPSGGGGDNCAGTNDGGGNDDAGTDSGGSEGSDSGNDSDISSVASPSKYGITQSVSPYFTTTRSGRTTGPQDRIDKRLPSARPPARPSFLPKMTAVELFNGIHFENLQTAVLGFDTAQHIPSYMHRQMEHVLAGIARSVNTAIDLLQMVDTEQESRSLEMYLLDRRQKLQEIEDQQWNLVMYK